MSIRFFLVAIAIVAAMLAGERWFSPPSLSFPKENTLFYSLVQLVWPVAESSVLFGVGYSIAASGKHKLVGLGVIGLYLMWAAIWLSFFLIFVHPEMVKSSPISKLDFLKSAGVAIFSTILTQLLAVGLLALAGYRFAIVQRKLTNEQG